MFRKYLDYDAYAGAARRAPADPRQGTRRDYADNVKLGRGGIREVEFIVQVLQIVRGGREPALRMRGTLPAVPRIEARGLLPHGAVADAPRAYEFLRDVEHRLQYRDDQQTQSLPDDRRRAHAASPRRWAAPTSQAFDALLARAPRARDPSSSDRCSATPATRENSARVGGLDRATMRRSSPWDASRAAGYRDPRGLLAGCA